ncbi:hypothetical protein [Paenibacillus sp. AD87]|uniref:hypothetical protein n=1 Tax=Paenibacillus sp. AD87 TaxID=1528787 RepID=UPI0007E450AC|nr:hypothetical protein [Paenibacillus sp. AD87]OAX49977.1 hypothetical protein gpAD87_17430 [Paenibacillus sp. AD87]
MRKKIFMLGLVMILSLIGVSSAFAATNFAYVSPSTLYDTAAPVTGKGQYGRYGLEVTKGQVRIILSEDNGNGVWNNVHDFTLFTKAKDSHYVDYWMKNGSRYSITLIALPDTELGVGYVRD